MAKERKVEESGARLRGAKVEKSDRRAKEPKIKPLGDRIVVRRLEAEEKTAGGIVLPDTAKEKPKQGEVVAVGDGALKEDGERVPMRLKKGDRIVFTTYAGTEIRLAEEELLIMREDDVLGVIKQG